MSELYSYNVDLSRGEKYKIRIIPFDQILSNVNEYPGIYSWYIRPKPNREDEIVPLMQSLLTHSALHAKVTGNMRLEYSGTLMKEAKNIQDIKDEQLLRHLFISIPIPLYIGISINLKTRLSTHVKQLENTEKTSDGLDDNEGVKNDSDDESKFFAARLNSLFNKAGVSAKDCLYIRVIEYNRYGCSSKLNTSDKITIKKELEKIEYFSNSIFNPIFGRR